MYRPSRPTEPVGWLTALAALLLTVGAVRLGHHLLRPQPVTWLVAVGGAVVQEPAVTEGRLIVATERGELVALDGESGRALWRVPLPARPTCGLQVAGGRLLVASADGSLRAFDPTSGRPLWRATLTDSPASRLAVAGPTAWALTEAGKLWAFELAGGRLLRASRPATPVTDLAGWRDRLILTAADGDVSAVDPGGALQWRLTAAKAPVRWPVATEQLWVVADDGRLVQIDPLRGRIQQAFTLVPSALIEPGRTSDGLLLGLRDGRLARLVGGQVTWQVDLPAPVVARPAVAGDVIVLVDRRSRLIALEAASGRLRWRLHLPVDTTAPLVGDGQRVYFGTWRGEVGAVGGSVTGATSNR